MPTQTNRRDLLRGNVSREKKLRPPGATAASFERACTGCGDCGAACPEGIISTDARGAAILDLSLGACTFCGACARACPTDALNEARAETWPWRASVGANCLSLNQTTCRTCEDACEARAIRFRLALGGNAHPIIDHDTCTGCGACVSVCPAGAMSLTRKTTTPLEIRQ